MDRKRIFSLDNQEDFKNRALEIFKFQAEENQIYSNFLMHLNVDFAKIKELEEIPFLPIEFFKTHRVVSSQNKIEKIFLSSGTSGKNQSRHYISDLSIYEESYIQGFKHFYGDVENYTILALLPSYLEREGSSLIYMFEDLILRSKKAESNFYLNDIEALQKALLKLSKKGEKAILIGVSFALLEFIEKFSFDLNNIIIMETGGMKGRRKEIIREELHDHLSKGFGVDKIHSEYGMTELLSQAYSKGDGVFECPPWMKVTIRDTRDALTPLSEGRAGGINVIDLANINSCSFLATQDLGKLNSDGTFQVTGRFDNSDIRGCNLMI
jgi:phenylacetate-coenzyme A ligase PaaK-like adenylate-forming protein